jgi:hypothetical protein
MCKRAEPLGGSSEEGRSCDAELALGKEAAGAGHTATGPSGQAEDRRLRGYWNVTLLASNFAVAKSPSRWLVTANPI